MALNPRVKTHADVISTATKKKEKKHWKRNAEHGCDVRNPPYTHAHAHACTNTFTRTQHVNVSENEI